MERERDGASPEDSSSEDNPGDPGGSETTSSTSQKVWPKVRLGLQVIEAGFVLTQHDALASAAGAFVVAGDLIFCPRSKN
ncbi:hypothetical protein [Streptomyces agglomeratus]|uniref:hypothetical protein n=1 Tax=Streptomyces agglomeratus TaxID=285458 RepID=UPI00114D247A|nr:hypothetical protein [Streptomyces agglomeratus]